MQSVQRLLVDKIRNAKTGVLLCIALQSIIDPRVSAAFFQLFLTLASQRFLDFFPVDMHDVLIELIELFVHCHAGEKVADALLNRRVFVLIDHSRPPCFWAILCVQYTMRFCFFNRVGALF